QAGFIRQYFPLFFIPERDLIIGAVLALALGFVAGILPALQAMGVRLSEALRREGETLNGIFNLQLSLVSEGVVFFYTIFLFCSEHTVGSAYYTCSIDRWIL